MIGSRSSPTTTEAKFPWNKDGNFLPAYVRRFLRCFEARQKSRPKQADLKKSKIGKEKI